MREHQDESFADLPSKLSMDMIPMYVLFQIYNTDTQFQPGYRLYLSVPGKLVSRDAEPQHAYVTDGPPHH